MKTLAKMEKNIGKILLILMICILVIGCSLNYMYASTDMYFMISTGREILANGFEKTNPFVIDSNLGFVVQQWAYCILLAFFDSLGEIGIIVFHLLNVAVLTGSACLFMSLWDIPYWIKFVVSSLIYCIMASFIGALRPEMITLSLLLIECWSLEKFRRTERPVWLVLLPITMLLESNLHSSAVWFHFAIVFAYIVPSVVRNVTDTSLFRQIRYPILFTISMAVSMFCNPYGVDAVFYMFSSLRGGIMESHFYFVMELQSGIQSIESLICLIIALSGLIFLCIFHKITSVCLYMTLGFSICTVMAMRNFMYFYMVFLYMLSPLLEEQNEQIEAETKRIFSKRTAYVIMISVTILITFMIMYNEEYIFAHLFTKQYLENEITDVAEYVRNDEDSQDASIFGPMEYCSIMEYYGFRNLLYDSRPELYTKAVNGKKDILQTIDNLFETNTVVNDTEQQQEIQQNIQNWIDSYRFTYIILPKEYVPYSTYWNSFWRFCVDSDDYREVMDNGMVLLFKRTDGMES